MTYLLLGILLWCIVHLGPAVAPDLRKSIVARTDEVVYKGIFGVLILIAVALMIVGWKSTPTRDLYEPPLWTGLVTLALMLVAAIFLFAPYVSNSVSRVIRHPQLTAVVLFGVGHLLSTGTNRGLVLFGGLAIWAILEIILINRRDGVWKKPEPAQFRDNVRLILTGLGFFIIFLFTHQWLFGVTPVPS